MSDLSFQVERMAQEMLMAEIPLGLRERLEAVEELCAVANGNLRSRQVIATIIVQWSAEEKAKAKAKAKAGEGKS